ncbi:hypothetical protein PR048_013684 [Dryococelus australis]|uniref:Uncharacterized protein n=1 Tax=Dryococelus australis TaxID=614101 RepID=A0ABQ9HTQ1_9NEOP|nr:hypothetical protein PR048_013684 [Dryococelus australis]
MASKYLARANSSALIFVHSPTAAHWEQTPEFDAHHLTQLVIEREHLQLLHANSELLFSSLNKPFEFRSWVSCLARVSSVRMFTGDDYTGSIYIKLETRKSKIKIKCYIVIFICMAK